MPSLLLDTRANWYKFNWRVNVWKRSVLKPYLGYTTLTKASFCTHKTRQKAYTDMYVNTQNQVPLCA
jgi:hypothetical protein